uniref:Conserved oligomeric Golgi complex subunit 6 n=1 Tax=Cacopsylla melanoneura TaxID=428564 RepID=A0A8D8RQM6_9HEMI
MDSKAGDISLQNVDSDDKNSAIIQKRLNKVIDTNIDNDKDVLEALKELSIFFTENTLISRRNLRSQIEKRSLSINEDFVSAFRKVKETLDSMHEDVLEMNNAVTSMTTQLQNTKAQTHQLIQQTTKLQAESDKISMKQKISEAFIREFQLTETELNILRNSNEISMSFFNVLDRVETINQSCKLLMQGGHETCALDIQQQMTLYKETGLDKIYRWCQIHCKDIESPDMRILLAKSMACLQEHGVLFSYILAEYCTCRRAILVRLFINALTCGNNAIETHAYDVRRYTGDMLGWLHATIPQEKTYLLALLKLCTRTNTDQVLSESLANISEGVTNPLRVRIEKILTSNTSPIVLYTVTSLLRHYRKALSHIIPSSSLDKTLSELVETSEGVFVNTLQRLVRVKILEKVEAPGPDLVPSPGVHHLLNLLREMLSSAQQCEDETDRASDTNRIVSNIIDPLLQTINLSASRLSTVHMSVYLLNCVHTMSRALEETNIGHYAERLAAQCDVQVDTLTSEQSSSFVVNLNLAPMYTILQEVNNKQSHTPGEPGRVGCEPLARIPGMEVTSLNVFLKQFDAFLANPNTLVLPQVNLILNGDHRNAILSRSYQVICAIYRQLYEAVHDPINLYENPTVLLARTPAEIRTMLEQKSKEEPQQVQTGGGPVVQDI